ncbi:glycerophosphodiester phosphodiesterase [Flavobacteriaceae bacterium F89]|uniref:Glycerophosphodiester phosphodiesterase n=1 Tax=Cerina litoralis TaxID=2874477 RepID=A0AAE3ET59_9FLAO|nr:glycerophosphodiester phosphodiesterase family protein [Cerina litoralis]MCG2460655.1 glycerophosphodiester phosphodiesterase [Cerina litoralis]
MQNFTIIGHRGAMGHETENTVASIRKALELGVDMIEVDVFKIKSGEIVVFHDETVDRLTDGQGNIENYYWTDLQKLTLGGNHRIPLLTEILEVMNHKVPINIELKGAGTARSVNTIIQNYIEKEGWELDDFLISSFDWNELKLMHQLNNGIKIGVLTEDNPLEAIPLARELKAVSINPNFGKLTPESLKTIRTSGFKVYAWTVNQKTDIDNMKELGVDGIFTNYPERAK